MYGNCANYPSVTSVDSLRQKRGWGYASAGRAVEALYFDNKSAGEVAAKKAMKAKIEEYAREGTRVSLHCVLEATYKKNNILDIPYSSVSGGKRKAFEIALMGMTEIGKVKNARYPSPLQGEVFISRLIIEDKCWYIEILQANKLLPNQRKPPVPAIKKRAGNDIYKFGMGNDYFISFLDDWY